jgi:hypothetical protein
MEIPELIDRLGEFESQAQLLTLQKQELIDAVKIPKEVQGIIEQNQKCKKELDVSLSRQLAYLDEQEKERLKEVVIPPEIQAALDAIDHERAQIRLVYDNQRTVIRAEIERRKNLIDGEFSGKISEVYAQVAARKQEITAEFADQIEAANKNIAKLTADVKAAVIKAGKSFRGEIYKTYQAVFVPGRITWKTDVLDGVYFTLNSILEMLLGLEDKPEEISGVRDEVKNVISALTRARKVGEPSVTLRKN